MRAREKDQQSGLHPQVPDAQAALRKGRGKNPEAAPAACAPLQKTSRRRAFYRQIPDAEETRSGIA